MVCKWGKHDDPKGKVKKRYPQISNQKRPKKAQGGKEGGDVDLRRAYVLWIFIKVSLSER